MVVRTSAWPSSSCTVRMSYPSSSRCVGEGVAQRVAPGRLYDARLADGAPHRLLDGRLGEMMPSAPAGARVRGEPARGKDVLPSPLPAGARLLAGERMG